MKYEAPEVTELGTVTELTQQKLNKVGASSDQFSNLTGLSGTIIPL